MKVETHREVLDRRHVGALRSLRRGDFSARLPEDVADGDAEIAALFNESSSPDKRRSNRSHPGPTTWAYS